MHEDLFRREVLEARRERWLGSVQLSNPRMAWPMTALAVAALLTLAGFLAFGRYTRSERVVGQLVPADGLLSVAAPVSGVVARIRVKEGQAVARDQPLLEISSDLDSPALRAGGVGKTVGLALTQQRERLLAERADVDRDETRETQALHTRIASLEAQQRLAADQLDLRRQQAAQARDLLKQVAPLRGDKLLSDLQWRQYESAAAEAQARVRDTQRERLDAQRQSDEARLALEQLPARVAERRNRLERELAGIAQDDARNEGQRRVAMRAPRAGRVAGLGFEEGQAVTQGQRLLSLIPERSPLRAELWVPSRAIGFLAPGGRVAIRYHAFPHQTFGRHDGRIVEIARSTLSPDEVRARTGLRVDAPAYRVLVELDRQDVATASGNRPLLTHMGLDADLLLERRRLYEFVASPLRVAGKDAR